MGSHEELVELCERMWQGERPIDTYREVGRLFEVTPDVALVLGFGNVAAVRTQDGLVLADTSQAAHITPILASLRAWDASRVDTVVYTHAHFDHAGGAAAIDDEAARRFDPPVRVVAHENVAGRFQRYRETAGYQAVINARQFRSRTGSGSARAWTTWREPDLTFAKGIDLTIGGMPVQRSVGAGLLGWGSARG
ncbi:MAG: MBL fold metallo-hydrolase [Dehalococcoidia bacterium]